MSQRVRGSDGKHKGFNDKDKFRSLWVTYSGMDWVSAMEQGALELCIEGPYSELYYLLVWTQACHSLVTLVKAQSAYLYNGHYANDINLIALSRRVDNFQHSIWLLYAYKEMLGIIIDQKATFYPELYLFPEWILWDDFDR